MTADELVPIKHWVTACWLGLTSEVPFFSKRIKQLKD
jgi:hypothetical protein